MKRIVVCLLAVLICFSIVGCDGINSFIDSTPTPTPTPSPTPIPFVNSFIGNWVTDDSSIRFEFSGDAYFKQKQVSDSIGFYETSSGNYTVDESRLYIQYGSGEHIEYFYDFKDRNNTLLLTTTKTTGFLIIFERTTSGSIEKLDIIRKWWGDASEGNFVEFDFHENGTFKQAILGTGGEEHIYDYTGTFEYDFYKITLNYEDGRQEISSYSFVSGFVFGGIQVTLSAFGYSLWHE